VRRDGRKEIEEAENDGGPRLAVDAQRNEGLERISGQVGVCRLQELAGVLHVRLASCAAYLARRP